VGSASGMQLLNMDLSRQAAAAAQPEDEAGAATQVSTCGTRLAEYVHVLKLDLSRQATAAAQQQDEAAGHTGEHIWEEACRTCVRAHHGPVTTSGSSSAAAR
jgi:hypothetical protein